MARWGTVMAAPQRRIRMVSQGDEKPASRRRTARRTVKHRSRWLYDQTNRQVHLIHGEPATTLRGSRCQLVRW
jgi:hypothetical protein